MRVETSLNGTGSWSRTIRTNSKAGTELPIGEGCPAPAGCASSDYRAIASRVAKRAAHSAWSAVVQDAECRRSAEWCTPEVRR